MKMARFADDCRCQAYQQQKCATSMFIDRRVNMFWSCFRCHKLWPNDSHKDEASSDVAADVASCQIPATNTVQHWLTIVHGPCEMVASLWLGHSQRNSVKKSGNILQPRRLLVKQCLSPICFNRISSCSHFVASTMSKHQKYTELHPPLRLVCCSLWPSNIIHPHHKRSGPACLNNQQWVKQVAIV